MTSYVSILAEVYYRAVLTAARNINGKLVKADIKKTVQAAYAEHKSRAKL